MNNLDELKDLKVKEFINRRNFMKKLIISSVILLLTTPSWAKCDFAVRPYKVTFDSTFIYGNMARTINGTPQTAYDNALSKCSKAHLDCSQYDLRPYNDEINTTSKLVV